MKLARLEILATTLCFGLACDSGPSATKGYFGEFISPVGYGNKIVFSGLEMQSACSSDYQSESEGGCPLYSFYRLYHIDTREAPSSSGLTTKKLSRSEDRECPGCENNQPPRIPLLALSDRLYLRKANGELEVYESGKFIKASLQSLFSDPEFEQSAHIIEGPGATVYTFQVSGVRDLYFIRLANKDTLIQSQSMAVTDTRVYYLQNEVLNIVSADDHLQVGLPSNEEYTLLSIGNNAYLFSEEADLFELENESITLSRNLAISTFSDAKARIAVVKNAIFVFAPITEVIGFEYVEVGMDVIIYNPSDWTYQLVDVDGESFEPKLVYADKIVVDRSGGHNSIIIDNSGNIVETIQNTAGLDADWLLYKDKVYYAQYPGRLFSFNPD